LNTDFVRNLKFIFGFNGFSYFLLFVIQLLIARFWGPELYGQINLIGNITAFLFIALAMGINNAMYKYLPSLEPSSHSRMISTAIVANIVTLSVVNGLLYFVFPLFIGRLKIPVPLWDLTLLYSTIVTLTCVFESFLRGKKDFNAIGIARLLSASLFFISIIILVFILRIAALKYYYVFYAVFYGIFFVVYTLSKIKLTSFGFDFKNLALIYKYGLYMMLTIFVTAVLYNSDMISLNYFIADRKDLGIYASYQGIIKLLFYVGFQEIFNVVFLPTIADKDRESLYRRIGRWVPVIIGGITFASAAFMAATILILGKEYTLNPLFIVFSSLSISLYALFQIYYSLLSMEGERGALYSLVCVAIVLPVTLVLQIVLIKQYLLPGALVSVMITNLLLVLLIRAFTKRYYKKYGRK
jgi:O-antigen/teichoic acid export membrane protein